MIANVSLRSGIEEKEKRKRERKKQEAGYGEATRKQTSGKEKRALPEFQLLESRARLHLAHQGHGSTASKLGSDGG